MSKSQVPIATETFLMKHPCVYNSLYKYGTEQNNIEITKNGESKSSGSLNRHSTGMNQPSKHDYMSSNKVIFQVGDANTANPVSIFPPIQDQDVEQLGNTVS